MQYHVHRFLAAAVLHPKQLKSNQCAFKKFVRVAVGMLPCWEERGSLQLKPLVGISRKLLKTILVNFF